MFAIRTGRETSLKRGQTTFYFPNSGCWPAAAAATFFAVGLPCVHTRSRRPALASKSLTNSSEPSGSPRLVARLIRSTSSVGSDSNEGRLPVRIAPPAEPDFFRPSAPRPNRGVRHARPVRCAPARWTIANPRPQSPSQPEPGSAQRNASRTEGGPAQRRRRRSDLARDARCGSGVGSVPSSIASAPDRAPEQATPRFRDRDEMNMVAHQAPPEDADIMVPRMFAKYLEVADSVVFGEEDFLSVVTPLRNMMRHARDHKARSARHAR